MKCSTFFSRAQLQNLAPGAQKASYCTDHQLDIENLLSQQASYSNTLHQAEDNPFVPLYDNSASLGITKSSMISCHAHFLKKYFWLISRILDNSSLNILEQIFIFYLTIGLYLKQAEDILFDLFSKITNSVTLSKKNCNFLFIFYFLFIVDKEKINNTQNSGPPQVVCQLGRLKDICEYSCETFSFSNANVINHMATPKICENIKVNLLMNNRYFYKGLYLEIEVFNIFEGQQYLYENNLK